MSPASPQADKTESFAGTNTLQTRRLPEHSSPPVKTFPSSPAARLLHRWLYQMGVFSDGYDTPYVLGLWMKFIPERIGQSTVIDSTVDCFLRSITTCATRDKKDLAITYATNANALNHIRTAIVNAAPDSMHEEALISIMILTLVEVIASFINAHGSNIESFVLTSE